MPEKSDYGTFLDPSLNYSVIHQQCVFNAIKPSRDMINILFPAVTVFKYRFLLLTKCYHFLLFFVEFSLFIFKYSSAKEENVSFSL